MKKYAHVKNEDDSIIKMQNYPDDFTPSSVNHKFGVNFNVRIIPYEEDDDLNFDNAVERQVTEELILLTKVRLKKTISAFTTEELAEIADALDRKNKLALTGSKVVTLRQWAETARSVTVTSGNAIAVVQGIVDNLEKFYDAFADLIEGQSLDK